MSGARRESAGAVHDARGERSGRLSGVNAELAAAVRRVNALYQRHPEPRPNVNGLTWPALERKIDRACAGGDRDAALEAIRAWEQRATERLGGER